MLLEGYVHGLWYLTQLDRRSSGNVHIYLHKLLRQKSSADPGKIGVPNFPGI